jgi:HAE1 family hydrophobic/amphiphilic exporter-1
MLPSTLLAQQQGQIAKNAAAVRDSAPALRTNTPSVNKNDPSTPLSRPTDLTRVGIQTLQQLPLSLQEAIRRALQNNNDIEVSRDDVRFQETQVRSLSGVYDPVFTAIPTFSRNSTTGSKATKDFRANANVGQFIRQGGGDYQVFFNNARTENAFSQAQVSSGSVTGGSSAIFTSSLGISYNQPLFRNFRIDSKRHQIIAYWDFVFALRNQQNQVANVNLARENLRQIEAKIDAGAAAPVERAEVETELANREGDLLLATQQVGITENTLKQLVLKDPMSNEWSDTVVPTDDPKFSLDPLNLDVAMKDAMDNRYELRRLKLQRDINATDIRFFKNQTKPQIDLNSTFSLDGLSSGGANLATNTNLLTGSADIFLLNSLNSTRVALGLPPLVNPPLTIPPSPSFLFGGFNRSLANIFRSDAPNFSVGMTISFPFRNRTAKANLDGARIQEQQLEAQTRGEEQTVIVEVRNAVQAVETARQRVLTARRALANAEIQLAGEQKLYEAGRSTTFLLFQRENTLLNAKNAEIRAETDFNKALADLQRVTSTAFRENNITIDEPVPGLR